MPRIPLSTPPKGRSTRNNKRTRLSPSSVERSAVKKINLNTSSSEDEDIGQDDSPRCPVINREETNVYDS